MVTGLGLAALFLGMPMPPHGDAGMYKDFPNLSIGLTIVAVIGVVLFIITLLINATRWLRDKWEES
jgi:hypothetical protein